jgi:hypothetical protein
MNFVLFNSWQSDTPFNSKAIRAALREACNKIETKIAGAHFKIDEAASNQVGSLHIPSSILLNISKSDIFISDLSTVGTTPDEKKKLQNPNVLIELGYAISQLGWDRIIILFNKDNGEFKDLPFDIEKRSCLDFRISSGDDKAGVGQLREDLIVRITSILETNPPKPSLKTEITDKSRQNDLKVIRRILFWLPLKDMDVFVKDGAYHIKKSLTLGAKQLDDFVESLEFHIVDVKLRRRIYTLCDRWYDMMQRLPKSYTLVDETFTLNALIKGSKKSSQLNQYVVEDVEKAYSSLINYLRLAYPEIEI